MASKHGTQTRYTQGCRCEDCITAHRVYQRDYRERKANGEVAPRAAVVVLSQPQVLQASEPGPVESAVKAELEGLAQTEALPGLAQTALALARIMDNPKAVSSQPPAAKVLAGLLDTLRKGASRGRRGGLELAGDV